MGASNTDDRPPAALRYVAELGVTGYRAAADRLVRAVRATGTPVELRGWHYEPDGAERGFVPHPCDDPALASVAPPRAPTVMHLVPEYLPELAELAAGPVAVHTVWETDRLPAHWPAILNRADRVIVPTEWNREVFAAGGVDVPIDVLPHIACDPHPGDRGEPLSLPDDVVVFYTISRWEPRKVPNLVVEAFLDAFSAADPVVLVVKTGRTNHIPYPDGWGSGSPKFGTSSWEVVRLMRGRADPPRILLEVDDWSDDRIAGLHTRGDCYVTLTHGEGWGVGSFDACAYGNPVIATGWGGHLAYLDDRALLIDHELVPVVHSAPDSYSPDQQWAEPNRDHAIEHMRAVAADPERFRRRAAPLRERVQAEFAPPVVADQFLGVVEQLNRASA